jgi:hypothetical protein
VGLPRTGAPAHRGGDRRGHLEQWFSILQRKRLRIVDCASKDQLRAQIEQFIAEWNQHAHPFDWSTKSVAKVMADAPAMAA